MRNDCYACRIYFDDCEDKQHPRRVRAKHLNGHFYWGKSAKDKPGRWVMICVPCVKALQES